MSDAPDIPPFPPQPSPPASRLLDAIANDNHAAFYQELKQIDDINMDQGALLFAAARAQNYLFMRELVTRGADIDYCISDIRNEMAKVPRKRYYDDYDECYYTRYPTPQDEKRYKELSDASDMLRKYQQHYIASIAPAEIAKNQQRLLDEIQALKNEIAELRDGKPLEKSALPAPGHLRKTGTTPPGHKP